MSYILDALRKSEEERLRERSPDFLREPIVTPSQVTHGWPRLAIALAILALGIATWFLWPTPRQPADEPAPQREGKPLVGSEVPPASPVEVPAVQANRHAQQPAPESTTKPTVPSSRGPERTEAAPKSVSAVEPQQGSATAPPSAELKRVPKEPEPPVRSARVEERSTRKTPAPEIPPPPNRVLDISELPPALREALPNLAMHGFVYTEDPRSRMVVINNRMLQEGDDIGTDIKLERIGPDGAVLNFKGYRFLAPR